MFNLFLLSMSLVTMADNALTFLLMWEGMSLTSYFLVITEANEPGTLRAGVWSVAMTHAVLAMLLAAFALLMSGGTGSFADLRANAAALSPALRNVIFVLALFGFGTKAGIAPQHVWLPMAHPVAPSHVSALMSGVVIKMGIYGLVRVVLDLLGGGPVWWGGVVLGVGAVSALLGVLYALMEHDLKKLLAYDVQARTLARVEEARESVNLIRQAFDNLPEGPLSAQLGSLPAFEPAFGIVEGWRGAIVHWVMADDEGRMYRVKVKDPSFVNWPALSSALLKNIAPDFPLCNKSFNQSSSGNDL